MNEAADSPELLVVGVDDHRASLSAARYAVWSATQRSAILRIVHSDAHRWPSRTSGGDLLRRVIAELEIPRNLRLEIVVESGRPADTLLRHAAEATQLILGQHHLRLGETVFGTGIASRLAARALCPVVIIPADYQLLRKPDPVLVALDNETTAEAALSTGHREAQLRKVDLVLMHLAPVGQLTGESPWADFADQLADWTSAHPDVPTQRIILPGKPEDMILAATPDSSLVVVGRPHAQGSRTWSRSVAESVLQHSRCPLAVVPPLLAQHHRTLATAADAT